MYLVLFRRKLLPEYWGGGGARENPQPPSHPFKWPGPNSLYQDSKYTGAKADMQSRRVFLYFVQKLRIQEYSLHS